MTQPEPREGQDAVPAVGTAAPEITLPNRNGDPRSLSDYRGSPLVLVFFQFAFSPVCTDELCHLQDHADTFEEFGAKALTVSTDSPYALDAFARQESYDFEMLSDCWPHGAASQRFGVMDLRHGCARRHTFVLDAEGIIRDVSTADITQTLEWDRLRGVLESLPRA